MIKNVFTLLLLALLPTLAQARWNDDWTARNKISINAEAAGAALSGYPVAVRLHSGNFSFVDAKPDGSDLRFVAADDKTELKYHIEKFDAVNELALVWVQVPKLDPKDKSAHIWVYYGNENAPASADVKGTWDAATVAAFHFADKALLQDSSNAGLTASGDVTVQKAALLGEAAVFSGQPLKVPGAAAGAKSLTWSAWVKPAEATKPSVLFSLGGVSLRIDGGKLTFSSGQSAPVSGGELKNAVWQHVAVTVGDGKVNIYLNGAPVAIGEAAIAGDATEMRVGEGYVGEMDELEMASLARDAGWIKLTAAAQGPDGQVVTVQPGEDESESGEGASYIGILVDNLTIDAKVVIAILAVMFLISTVVMIGKARFISRTSRGNDAFLDRFRDARDNFLELGKDGEAYANSSIFRLYQAGIREIEKRYTDDRQLALSGASLDAIKASVDATLVRETHRTNAQMVLLTIAISGGPFLGLLGTVVGVMITFAAIAAAGDVNVNAIAPGIAAALLATVAGLGVAIPALFGYNYLASRIKNITTDMQIFVDEFITRVAEVHGK